jgi:hypothetical protein
MATVMKCETPLCCARAEVRLSWITSRGRETTALCPDHARKLWEELKKFPAHETIVCETAAAAEEPAS